jgi:hypothetical protein
MACEGTGIKRRKSALIPLPNPHQNAVFHVSTQPENIADLDLYVHMLVYVPIEIHCWNKIFECTCRMPSISFSDKLTVTSLN